MKKNFSLNDRVFVRLNPHGEQIWADYWRPTHPGGVPDCVRHTKDGWTMFQLWELMAIFGRDVRMGFELPFENTHIKLERTR